MIEAVADRFEGAFRRRRSDELKARVVAGALEPGASIQQSRGGSIFIRRNFRKR